MDLLGILSLYADHIIYFLKSMSHLLSLHLSSWRKSSLFSSVWCVSATR
ncbi:unnamed protein product [Brassica oleracea var. botrytis]